MPSVVEVFRFSLAACIFSNSSSTCLSSRLFAARDRFGLDDSKQGSERFAYASREDIHEGLRKSLPHDVALANAPDSDGTFFKVPKVIEK